MLPYYLAKLIGDRPLASDAVAFGAEDVTCKDYDAQMTSALLYLMPLSLGEAMTITYHTIDDVAEKYPVHIWCIAHRFFRMHSEWNSFDHSLPTMARMPDILQARWTIMQLREFVGSTSADSEDTARCENILASHSDVVETALLEVVRAVADEVIVVMGMLSDSQNAFLDKAPVTVKDCLSCVAPATAMPDATISDVANALDGSTFQVFIESYEASVSSIAEMESIPKVLLGCSELVRAEMLVTETFRKAKLLVQASTICQVLKRPLEGNETLASLCEVVLESMADSLDELPKDLVDLCRKHVAENAVKKQAALKTMRKFSASKKAKATGKG